MISYLLYYTYLLHQAMPAVGMYFFIVYYC